MSNQRIKLPVMPIALVLAVLLVLSVFSGLFGGSDQKDAEDITAAGIAYLEELEQKILFELKQVYSRLQLEKAKQKIVNIGK